MLNLISTVRGLLEEMADEFDCKDYSTVAEKLLAVEEQADLSYYHMEGRSMTFNEQFAAQIAKTSLEGARNPINRSLRLPEMV